MAHTHKNRLYRIYCGMKQRCYNTNHINYDIYGGLGISICDEWLNSFDAFESWAHNSKYADDLTIDRINPCKNYCPENCRWITHDANSRLTRRWDDGWKPDNQKKHILYYPAIFHKAEEGGFWITFPDFSGCVSDGDNMSEAYEMASEALGLSITTIQSDGQALPSPSSPDLLSVDANSFLVIVEFDMAAYLKKHNSKSVKKTLTIPGWLDEEASAMGINFSQILQEALIGKIQSCADAQIRS